MTKLLVGLGNPGQKYQKHRHNLGFRVLDELVKHLKAKFLPSKKLPAEIAESFYNDVKLIVAKPLTFMNNSGQAVKQILTTYRIPLAHLLIIHDEIDLPFGVLRFSKGQTAAGHKGIESIIQAVGREGRRLRIGIENRREYRIPDTEKYVLQNFTKPEEKELKDEIIPRAVAEIEKFLTS